MSGEPPLEEDRALLDGFKSGDREALGRVFRRYADDVARTLQRGVRVEIDGAPQRVGGDLSPWDLENLLQETFVKAFSPSARQSYDGLRPFGAWLATIARNALIDRARRQQRERESVVSVDDVHEGAMRDDDKGPAALLAERHTASVVRTFIAGLSDDDRALFTKRYEEQRSLRQAASELRVGLFELRKRDARLRLALLEALRDADVVGHRHVRVGTSVLRRGRGTPAQEET